MAVQMTGLAKIGEVQGTYVATQQGEWLNIEISAPPAKFRVQLLVKDVAQMAELVIL